MSKITNIIIVLVVLAVLILVAFLASTQLTGETIRDFKTYTKAICNESNFCQDHEITCLDGEATAITPINGATIQHTEDWIDPRNSSDPLC